MRSQGSWGSGVAGTPCSTDRRRAACSARWISPGSAGSGVAASGAARRHRRGTGRRCWVLAAGARGRPAPRGCRRTSTGHHLPAPQSPAAGTSGRRRTRQSRRAALQPADLRLTAASRGRSTSSESAWSLGTGAVSLGTHVRVALLRRPHPRPRRPRREPLPGSLLRPRPASPLGGAGGVVATCPTAAPGRCPPRPRPRRRRRAGRSPRPAAPRRRVTTGARVSARRRAPASDPVPRGGRRRRRAWARCAGRRRAGGAPPRPARGSGRSGSSVNGVHLLRSYGHRDATDQLDVSRRRVARGATSGSDGRGARRVPRVGGPGHLRSARVRRGARPAAPGRGSSAT